MTRYEVQLHDNSTGYVTVYCRRAGDEAEAVKLVVGRLTISDRGRFKDAAMLDARVRIWTSEDPNAWGHYKVSLYRILQAHVTPTMDPPPRHWYTARESQPGP